MSKHQEAPVITIKEKGLFEGLRLLAPSNMVCKRIASWLTAEPDTIDWIKNRTHGGLFIDIGANIGIFSIYASLCHFQKVISVEPDAGNLYVLNSNIFLNTPRLDNIEVLAMAAFSQEGVIDYYSNYPLIPGHALNQISQPVHYEGVKTSFTTHSIKVYATTVDRIVSSLGANKYKDFRGNSLLKIDVDTLEFEVILGSLKSISESFFDSILIEIDTDNRRHSQLIRILQSLGFEFDKKLANQSLQRNRRLFPAMSTVCNLIFSRQGHHP